jgi:DNA replication and repair protein RecF
MPFLTLRFSSFRNLEDTDALEVGSENVILSGENGQGKTNLLEALYMLSFGASFRTRKDDEIARTGSRGYAVSARIVRGGIESDISVSYSNACKSIYSDGKAIKDRSQLVKGMPCVLFSHEDLEFSNGPQERRRWFMDQSLSMLDPSFLESLRRYKSVVRARTAALRSSDEALIDAYDEQMVEYGLELTRRRKNGAVRFNEAFSATIANSAPALAGTVFEYYPSWDPEKDASAINERMKENRRRELALCQSVSGPHRDRYCFKRKGLDVARYASMGQLRMLSIALRVAQARHFAEITGRKAVLLLDDVLLELDQKRRSALLASLPSYEQAFFTFLPGFGLDGIAKGTSIEYHVIDGRFENKGGI